MFSIFRKKEKPAAQPPVVVPRIKHTNFLVALAEIPGMTQESRPVTEPLAGDLLLTYAIDIGPSYLSVTPANLGEYNLRQDELRRLAEANGLEVLRGMQVRTDGPVHELTAPENMAACVILYPELWRQIEQELGGPVLAAFPHRDFALYALADDAGIAALRGVLDRVDFNDNHALSALLYRPSPEGWQVFAR